MKRLLFFALLVPCFSKAQNYSTSAPSGSSPIASITYRGIGTDSTRRLYFYYNNAYNRIFSATEVYNNYAKLNGGNIFTGTQTVNGGFAVNGGLVVNNFAAVANMIDANGGLQFPGGVSLIFNNNNTAAYSWFITNDNTNSPLAALRIRQGTPTNSTGVDIKQNNIYDATGVKFLKQTDAYTKSYIDSAIAASGTQTYYVSDSTGNSISSNELKNVTVLSVTRSGSVYYPTASTSPVGSFFNHNPTNGTVLFQDAFNSTGEAVTVNYRASYLMLNGQNVPVITYATNAAIVYPTSKGFIMVSADETKGNSPTLYYAPAGAANASQLIYIYSYSNNFTY